MKPSDEIMLRRARDLIADLAAQHFKDQPQCSCDLLERSTAWCSAFRSAQEAIIEATP